MKIVKKITLRDLYRRAGQIAKEAQKGVTFEVYSREKRVFNIYNAQKNKNCGKSQKEILHKYAGVYKNEPKFSDKSDDELIYGKNNS